MKERPIIFSGAMVRAILDGRKTQTRRVVKSRRRIARNWRYTADRWWVGPHPGGGWWAVDCPEGPPAHLPRGGEGFPCPYGAPGDRLWVRHAWWHYKPPSTNPANEQAWDEWTRCVRWPTGQVVEDCEPDVVEEARKGSPWGWKRRPSIHMPRWASRLSLAVTDVRVERVQDISHEDIIAEGTPCHGVLSPAAVQDGALYVFFRDLWDSINGKRGPWASNPWVWVVTFETCSE